MPLGSCLECSDSTGNYRFLPEGKVWVDGISASSYTSGAYGSFTVPATATLLATHVKQTVPGYCGQKLSVGTFYSDTVNWRCHHGYESGWETIGFDDSSWSIPQVCCGNSDGNPVSTYATVLSETCSDWYCRGHLIPGYSGGILAS